MQWPLFMREVKGESMLPALRPGKIVVARKNTNAAQIGDIVIFKHDGHEKIKRIKHIDIGKVFLVGDNTDKSVDSRHFGMVDVRDVLGLVIWPRTKRNN